MLTDGTDDWIVADWDAVREFSDVTKKHSFNIWIGVDGDGNPGEDISYAYGTQTGNGDGGLATVGAENKFGNRGQNTYYNGTGASAHRRHPATGHDDAGFCLVRRGQLRSQGRQQGPAMEELRHARERRLPGRELLVRERIHPLIVTR